MSRLCCMKCKFFTDTNCHLKQHLLTKKHLKTTNEENETTFTYNCENCDNKYQTKSGLWKHIKTCKAPETIVPVINTDVVSAELHREVVDNLQRIIIEMAKNQQPTTINNNTNYINVFLNDKCRNACDIKKFIAGIDFSKENYNNLLMDYVGGNAEIISKNYKSLPEHERPVYSFDGEDEHQKVAHIQHDNKWIVERELGWEKQVRREYNDGVNDDPEPNSMYSLVRLFDKKKMKYFDENYKQSHLYLSQRKLNRDCLDDGKQLELINRIIEMAKVEP